MNQETVCLPSLPYGWHLTIKCSFINKIEVQKMERCNSPEVHSCSLRTRYFYPYSLLEKPFLPPFRSREMTLRTTNCEHYPFPTNMVSTSIQQSCFQVYQTPEYSITLKALKSQISMKSHERQNLLLSFFFFNILLVRAWILTHHISQNCSSANGKTTINEFVCHLSPLRKISSEED